MLLTPTILLEAYRRGIYPMGDPGSHRIDWHAPDPRAILPLESFHTPRSLVRVCRSQRFEVVSDRDFEAVIDGCAARAPTWITPPMRSGYLRLHRAGHAHSVEAWRDGRLVGGLYGVHVGGAFMGESMFHRATDASKVCLVALVMALRRRGFVLLDVQAMTAHLMRFGAVLIPRQSYQQRLSRAIELAATWAAGPMPVEV
ncbi:MAG: leucyl/phenylalanyl-tRNA--protein transferase [Planctomycetota bacterium]